MSVHDKISRQLAENPVILYMKGSAELPLCGFSAQATKFLKACGVPFTTIDVLQDEEIRQGIKDYANWPTIPQLYVKGEFIGGSDIMAEMFAAGELQALLQKAHMAN